MDLLEILNTPELILLAVLGFSFIIQMLYQWAFFAKPLRYVQNLSKGKIPLSTKQPPVSIIVIIKNEFYDLSYFLPPLLEQNYPQFEVIIVNDGFSDENEFTLRQLLNKYPHLYSTKIPDGTRSLSRKKLALSVGIKAARYEHLLFTEPDSYPESPDWIASMIRHYQGDKTIVLGLSVKQEETGFWNRYIAFDYLFSNLKFLSLALFKRPYAGDGHNLSYKKNHFERGKGFSKYLFLSVGGDDLFINTIADRRNTAVEISPQGIMKTRIDGFHDYKNRKVDRLTSAHFFKKGPVAFWRLELLFRIIFFLSIISCFIGQEIIGILPIAAMSLYLIRLLSQIIIGFKINKCLELKEISLLFPLYDLIQPFLDFCFYLRRILHMKEHYVMKI